MQMRENGYMHEYRVGNGGHTGKYWRQCLKDVLPYLDVVFNGKTGHKTESEETEEHKPQADQDGGTILYFAYEDLDKDLAKEIEDMIRSTEGSGPLRVIPCNLNEKSLSKFIRDCEKKYTFVDSQVIAIGTAGREAYALQGKFSRLYFDNADLTDNESLLNPHPAKFWVIAQTDDGEYYKDMGWLYKACKKTGASFEYRVRDGLQNNKTNTISGIETILNYLIY